MERDISKKTVVVLLILTIIVAALGMWTVLERLSLSQKFEQQTTGSATGQVKLTILPNLEAPIPEGGT